MRKRVFLLGTLLVGVLLYSGALPADAQTEDEKEIRALVQRLVTAARAKDVSDIMSSVYIADESLSVFDITPPLQYVGAKAYKKAWEDFFAAFPGPVEIEIHELSVTTDGPLGFSHEIDTWRMTDPEGKKVTFTMRVTYVYRKVNGKWRIIHEHGSVPVDVTTGRAELSLKP
jgi:uncharacterized protein (TIGR02246 family)